MAFERKKLFDGAVEYIFLGKGHGDSSSLLQTEAGAAKRKEIMSALNIEQMFFPRVEFKTGVANFHDSNTIQLGPGLWRTQNDSDAGLVFRDTRVGIGILTYDCPIGVVWDPIQKAMCVVRLGLKNIFRRGWNYSILEEVVMVLKTPPEKLRFWVGCGIGPCCYGHDKDEKQEQEIRSRFGKWGTRLCLKEVEHGPRKGKVSYHLQQMIYCEADRLGIDDSDVLEQEFQFGWDSSCTCHEGEFWSRVAGDKKRNLFLARIAPTGII